MIDVPLLVYVKSPNVSADTVLTMQHSRTSGINHRDGGEMGVWDGLMGD
ncbi:MAG: hypothetical protein NTV46_17025 [Verrucomicrobia bacterium]|nr:hypothetical protein [Verrucomicrobiota bacterium]